MVGFFAELKSRNTRSKQSNLNNQTSGNERSRRKKVEESGRCSTSGLWFICQYVNQYADTRVITAVSYKLSYPGSSSESESEDSAEPKRKSKYSSKVKESASDTKAINKDLKSRSSTLS